MREQSLIDLGFKKGFIEPIDSGSGTREWYYTLDFMGSGKFVEVISLITNTNIESNGNWTVEFYETLKYSFTKKSQLKKFIDLMKEIDTSKS